MSPATKTLICTVLAAITLAAPPAGGATLPAGFQEVVVASGLSSPTAMQFAPDGRLFVAEQGGSLRVIKNGTLLSAPFVTVTVSSAGERGLLGVAFDPNFATNHFVYIYYTATSPTVHNRISRLTANSDVAVAGSEVVLLELDDLSSATNHNGGALAFGADGKLYAAAGDNANGANAQSLTNLLGKLLRINKDGTIPADNPFNGSTSGRNRAIWALGLRNPFTFAFRPAGAELFINDVGQNTWEEINDGIAGANYGWPETEGATSDPRFISPLYTYDHSSGACAITGGAFYVPLTTDYPAEYVGDYFFADYCAGWIRKRDADTGHGVTTFATGISAPVDLKVSDEGHLYYLARGSGAVYRIEYGNSAPAITMHPSNRTVQAGASVTFSVRASGAAPLRYQWQRNGTAIAGATASDYTIDAVATTDNGARFRAVVSNDFGAVVSDEAVLTVSSNRAPTATITQPVAGTLYTGGMTITYAGTGSDPEDGTLPASAFTWQIDFHHDTHIHPFMPPTTGARSGTVTIPTTGETSANVWYRIILTVRDSAGLTQTTVTDVLPRKAKLTLATSPAGLVVKLDAQPRATPFTVDSVVGIERTLEAVSPQVSSGGTVYQFTAWSDGRARVHSLATPAADTTYTAAYAAAGSGSGDGLTATYYDNADFSGASVARVDPTINFDWGTGSPAPTIGVDTFSVRWVGQLEAPISGAYTFFTQTTDGVRLWVNRQLIINNWTNHPVTENTGTITLNAGQRYAIQMDFYENTGRATAKLLWSAPSMSKAVVPTARLYSQVPTSSILINFQTATAPVPAGYLADGGARYGDRGNGHAYGWNVDNTAQARDRNAANSPDQRYDTLVYMQKPANPNASWELALPNGTYRVRIVAGDPSFFGGTFAITAEGTLVVSGSTTSATRWLDGTATVAVSDGRLTLRNGAGATKNEICFIEITTP